MYNYFGTDGIRGEYGKAVTEDIAYKLGAALGGDESVAVVGRDTRVSGESLLAAFAEGVWSQGGNVVNIGVLPTNAVAFFTRKLGADYGVMISASHNLAADNGLKVFDKYGIKICLTKQREISRKIDEKQNYSGSGSEPELWGDAESLYLDDLFGKFDGLGGMEITLDLAHGAAYSAAPKIFERLGARVTKLSSSPDGEKINYRCGAATPEFLRSACRTELGFAYDGDADRLAVVENGVIIDNNRIFYAVAKYMEENKMLSRGIVVGTVLTNAGAENALMKIGLKLSRSEVGDIKIAERMNSLGVNLGGEESGHYLVYDYATSSDSVINSLLLANIVRKTGPISEYTKEMSLVKVSKMDFTVTDEQKRFITESNLIEKNLVKLAALFPETRTVLRLSGTEPKVRIFVEADENAERVMEAARELFDEALTRIKS